MQAQRNACQAGEVTPGNEESPAADTARALGDHGNKTQANCEAPAAERATATSQNFTSCPGTVEADRKLFSTLQARAALAGVALSRMQDDRGNEVFIASKWALTKQLSTLAEVEHLLVRIGGQHAS